MAAAAPALVPVVVKAFSSVTSLLLGAHIARLKAAQSENAALATIIDPYDQDVKYIVSAYNSGQATAAQCIQALQTIDAKVYAYLKGGVQKSGTAWSDASGMAGKCDKTCTAGCCVYFGDLGPPLSLLQIAMGGAGSKWGKNDPRFSEQPGGYVITVPQVFASKYGGVNRPSYTLSVLKRATLPRNPAQFAQSDSPTTAPLGRVSAGTPTGQTPSFSAVSQSLLGKANMLSSMPYPASSGVGFTNSSNASMVGGGSNLLVIAGVIIAVVGAVAYAASK